MWVGVVAAGADVAGTSGATLLTGGRVGGVGGKYRKVIILFRIAEGTGRWD